MYVKFDNVCGVRESAFGKKMRENHAKRVNLDRLTSRLETDEKYSAGFKQKISFHYYLIHVIYIFHYSIWKWTCRYLLLKLWLQKILIQWIHRKHIVAYTFLLLDWQNDWKFDVYSHPIISHNQKQWPVAWNMS